MRNQQGAMAIALLMLMVILGLGLAVSQSAVQAWITARNDTDRSIALQAAEAALRDAELDILNSPDPAKSRSKLFSSRSAFGFPAAEEPGCRRGATGIYRGLCRSGGTESPVWQTANFSDDDASTESVAFGTFTGQQMQVGKGALPVRLPRYIIELFVFNKPGEAADHPSYFYRVTAVGFGARESTQVAVQSFFRKEDE